MCDTPVTTWEGGADWRQKMARYPLRKEDADRNTLENEEATDGTLEEERWRHDAVFCWSALHAS